MEIVAYFAICPSMRITEPEATIIIVDRHGNAWLGAYDRYRRPTPIVDSAGHIIPAPFSWRDQIRGRISRLDSLAPICYNSIK